MPMCPLLPSFAFALGSGFAFALGSASLLPSFAFALGSGLSFALGSAALLPPFAFALGLCFAFGLSFSVASLTFSALTSVLALTSWLLVPSLAATLALVLKYIRQSNAGCESVDVFEDPILESATTDSAPAEAGHAVSDSAPTESGPTESGYSGCVKRCVLRAMADTVKAKAKKK